MVTDGAEAPAPGAELTHQLSHSTQTQAGVKVGGQQGFAPYPESATVPLRVLCRGGKPTLWGQLDGGRCPDGLADPGKGKGEGKKI